MILSLGHSNTITAIIIKTGLGALLIATLLSTSPVLAEDVGSGRRATTGCLSTVT